MFFGCVGDCFDMDYIEQGSSGVRFMTRKDIYDILKSCNKRSFDEKLDFTESKILELYSGDEDRQKDMKHKFSMIKSQFKSRWHIAHKKKSVFEKHNNDWLQGRTSIPYATAATVALPGPSSSSLGSSSLLEVGPGRPKKPFTESSDRSKRRKTEMIRSHEIDELTYATQMKLRESGALDAANVVQGLMSTPTRAQKYRKAYKKQQNQEELQQLTPLNALSMFVDAGLTRSQYERVRSSCKRLYPCYSVIQRAKRDCYPTKESISVTATCAEVQLQELLNHTTLRLITYLNEVVDSLRKEEKKSLILISKWGCDGSQQVQYKQKFDDETDSDANIFQSSMVPLQLKSGEKVIWKNPFPSSPRYCRPIRIRFVHETTDITNDEIRYIENQINALIPTEVEDCKIGHTMLFTMVDGKVCNAATQTKSTMRCYICGATSKEFNDLSKRRNIDEESLKFGLSVLHARIRFFESLLHIAYKLPIKKWQKRTKEDRDAVDARKKMIQERFKKEAGLLVDFPKAHFGNTNDGNTSRRFFADHELAASITGIDVNLIYRFKIILEVLSSGYKINIEEFEKYATETEKLYVNLYDWHPMSPTVHKILRHGALVIKKALLPIGQLSEEAAEARNKHFRNYRLNYARKFSREACNLDVLNRLLLTSDPLLTSIRKRHKKMLKPFSEDALKLLLPSDYSSVNYSDDDELSE